MFKNKIAVITGGAKGIGKCIADEFRKNGAVVYVIDKADGDHFVGDISDKTVLRTFCFKSHQRKRSYRLSYKQCTADHERHR